MDEEMEEMDFTKLPYAKWLEDGLREIFNHRASSICITALNEDGTSTTGYWNTSPEDKGIIAHQLMMDAALDMVLDNIGLVREALDAYDAEMGGEE